MIQNLDIQYQQQTTHNPNQLDSTICRLQLIIDKLNTKIIDLNLKDEKQVQKITDSISNVIDTMNIIFQNNKQIDIVANKYFAQNLKILQKFVKDYPAHSLNTSAISLINKMTTIRSTVKQRIVIQNLITTLNANMEENQPLNTYILTNRQALRTCLTDDKYRQYPEYPEMHKTLTLVNEYIKTKKEEAKDW